MNRKRVLVVEDDPSIRNLVEINLREENYETEGMDRGLGIRKKLNEFRPDLVILDVMLPFKSGFEIIEEIRSDADWQEVPIFMLTSRNEEEDVLKGLNLGADDYIKKPFSPKELLARIKNRLGERRRSQGIKAADLFVCPEKMKASVGDRPVKLSTSEFRLLELLASRLDHPVSRERIIDVLRGPGYAVTERTVDVLVSGLRKKIKESVCRIKSVRGLGYRLTPSDS